MLKLPVDHEVVLSYKNNKNAELLLSLVDQNRLFLRKWLRWVDDTNNLQDILNFMAQGKQTNIFEPLFAMEIWYRDELAGIVGFNNGNESQASISIGYWITERHQGKGIVTKACRRLINFAFQDFELNTMHLSAGTDNLRSRKIAEKLGFEFTGIDEKAQIVNEMHIDLANYQLTRSGWKKLDGIYS